MLLRDRYFGSAQVFAGLAFLDIASAGVDMTMTGCKPSGMAMIIFLEMLNVQLVGLSHLGAGFVLRHLCLSSICEIFCVDQETMHQSSYIPFIFTIQHIDTSRYCFSQDTRTFTSELGIKLLYLAIDLFVSSFAHRLYMFDTLRSYHNHTRAPSYQLILTSSPNPE